MYSDVGLVYYRFAFMAELLAAELLFCFRLHSRSFPVFRWFAVVVLSEAFTYFLPILSYDGLYQTVYFFILFSFTVLCLFFVLKEDWTIIIFFAVASYTCQHMAYEALELIVVTFNLNGGEALPIYAAIGQADFFAAPLLPFILLLYLDIYFLIYLLTYLVFMRRFKKGQNIVVMSTQLLLFVSFVIIADILLNSLLIGYSYETYDQTYLTFFHISNIISCILAISFQFRLVKDNAMAQDLETAHRFLHQRQEQYATSKENI